MKLVYTYKNLVTKYNMIVMFCLCNFFIVYQSLPCQFFLLRFYLVMPPRLVSTIEMKLILQSQNYNYSEELLPPPSPPPPIYNGYLHLNISFNLFKHFIEMYSLIFGVLGLWFICVSGYHRLVMSPRPRLIQVRTKLV